MSHHTSQINTFPLRSSRRQLIIALFIGGVLFGLAGIIWTITGPNPAKPLNLATTRQTERFTELYFNNPQTLPKEVTAEESASFSYHVANHEATDITYSARITIVENGRLRVLKQDRFLVKNGAEHNVTVNFTTAQPDTRLQLIVDLVDQSQSIHFRSES